MTAERQKAIYARLQEMTLVLSTAVERGPTYLLDQIQSCRILQDEAVQILTEVRRAFASVKKLRRAERAKVALLGTPDAKADLRKVEDDYDDLQTLESVVNTIRRNLSQTDSDIRLAAKLVEQQIRLGQIQPREKDYKDAVPAPLDVPLDIGTVPEFVPPTGGETNGSAPEFVPPVQSDAVIFATEPQGPGTQGAAVNSLESIDRFLRGDI